MTTSADRCPIDFDYPAYLAEKAGSGEIRARPVFPVDRGHPDNRRLLRESLSAQFDSIRRAPIGHIRHPWLVPGATYGNLWDWDAFFCGADVPELAEHFRGTISTLLDHCRADGHPAKKLDGSQVDYASTAMPLQAQWCAMVLRDDGDLDWLRRYWPTLQRIRDWYDGADRVSCGLYRCLRRHSLGLDNDPVLYGRRGQPVAAVHLNVFHCREERALAVLAERLGDAATARRFAERAEALAAAIECHLFDPIDGMYYHCDLAEADQPGRQGVT